MAKRLGPNTRIVKDLQKHGYSRRQAVKYAGLVFNIWKQAIMAGDSVETPVGIIRRVPETRKMQRRWSILRNSPETIYKHKFRLVVEPKDDLLNE